MKSHTAASFIHAHESQSPCVHTLIFMASVDIKAQTLCCRTALPYEAPSVIVYRSNVVQVAWYSQADACLYWDRNPVCGKAKFQQVHCKTARGLPLTSAPQLMRVLRAHNSAALLLATNSQVIRFLETEPVELWSSPQARIRVIKGDHFLAWIASSESVCVLYFIMRAQLLDPEPTIYKVDVPEPFGSITGSALYLWQEGATIGGTLYLENRGQASALLFAIDGANITTVALRELAALSVQLLNFPRWITSYTPAKPMFVETRDVAIDSLEDEAKPIAYGAITLAMANGVMRAFIRTEELQLPPVTPVAVSLLASTADALSLLAEYSTPYKYLFRYLWTHPETQGTLNQVLESTFAQLSRQILRDGTTGPVEIFLNALDERVMCPNKKRRKDCEVESNADSVHLRIVVSRLLVLRACTTLINDPHKSLESLIALIPQCPSDLGSALQSFELEQASVGSPHDDFILELTRWSRWLQEFTLKAPPSESLTDFYTQRRMMKLRPHVQLNEVAFLNHQHLARTSRDTARALCYFWGRFDLMLNYGLSRLQDCTNTKGNAWAQPLAREPLQLTPEVKAAWDMTTEEQVKVR
eukprot:Blabericola_migrator_1__11737@NODE_70_length_15323_cov_105_367593_g63_i0_p3_GENE_NODE_70_length_15323_cov_105_367593_g63_i0NODE_70_length_15323_cov_105_367593_g63_i0_p3_ORF_typecomplete_len586_score63_51_NODE_70_length_15323_cov_105_367593_g63_i065678324